MSVYHLMAMSLNQDGFVELETISHNFLWGQNELGENKKALVAWDDTTYCKAEGGLGFEEFPNLSLILKMRWCNRLLTDGDEAWVLLAIAGIKRSLNAGYRRRSRRYWTAAKALLLDDNTHVSGSPFLKGSFQGI